VDFTGEEGLGRFLDMHELFQRFTNLIQRAKGGKAKGGRAAAGEDGEDGEEDAIVKAGQEGGDKQLEYYEYLTSFHDFSTLSRQLRISKPFRYAALIHLCRGTWLRNTGIHETEYAALSCCPAAASTSKRCLGTCARSMSALSHSRSCSARSPR
jgi:hypothetical protein